MRRYPFMSLAYDIWVYLKGSIFFIIFLFILNPDSKSFIFFYGRYVFVIVTILTFIYFVLKWWTYKYQLADRGFYLRRGVFVKKEEYIPFSKVENIQRQTLVFHRLFNLTALRFETAMSGENAKINFDALSKEAAREMEAEVTRKKENKLDDPKPTTEADDPTSALETEETERKQAAPTIHFTPKRGDLIRASFTSLSFLLLIPIVLSIVNKASDFFPIESKAEEWLAQVIQSWWLIAMLVTVLIVISVIFGIVRVFIKYGKYTISSDDQKIYITQGTVSEMHFSIAKKNVQAVEIKQTFLKRLLGLAEVKLISAGNTELDDEDTAINSLYPFLPIRRAYEIIETLLPNYTLSANWQKLPRRVFYYRLCKHAWFFLLVSGFLTYFKPSLWNVSQAWWIGILLLFAYMIWTIYLNYKHSALAVEKEMFHFKQGSFTTTEFISRREMVVEAGVTQSLLQRKIGLTSLNVTHRSNEIFNRTNMEDVSASLQDNFLLWYMSE